MLATGFWNDDNCAIDTAFICKKRKGTFTPKTTQPTPVLPGFCPEGFYGIGKIPFIHEFCFDGCKVLLYVIHRKQVLQNIRWGQDAGETELG